MIRELQDYLADVLAYAETAARIAQSGSLEDVAGDEVRRLALERALELAGEAAGKLPLEFRARYADLPWSEMIGLRNRLAHGYFSLSVAILYRTAREVIPLMLPRLREVVRLEGANRPPPA